MSRRSRRKGNGGKKSWLGRIFIGLVVLLLVGVAVGYVGLRKYLQSEDFRKFMSAEVSEGAEVVGEFDRFTWDGLAVRTEKFDSKGEGEISVLRADGIETEIGFGGVSRGVWEVKNTRLRRLEIRIDTTKKKVPAPVEPKPKQKKKKVKEKQPGWVPKEAELQSLDIGEVILNVVLEHGVFSAEGMAIRMARGAGDALMKGEIIGGVVRLPDENVPPLNVKRIKGSFGDGSLFVTSGEISAWRDGRIELSGEYKLEPKTFAFEGGIDGVKCNELLSENWAQRLSGDFSTTFTVDNRSGDLVTSGEMKVRNGVLTALPMLDALSAYADTSKFRRVQLSEAKTDWRHEGDVTSLTNFVLASEGLVRLEGEMTIRGEELDGTFMLGIAPGTLRKIPGAETVVFKRGSHGLLWTPLRVTGTKDDPDEDLTSRLIEAAGLRMLENLPEHSEVLMKFAKEKLGDTIGEQAPGLINEGMKMLLESEKVKDEVGGFLNSILGD
ncbi:MAG: hypothetical protein ACSHX7_05455 [Luteolibacter sp.]